MINSSLKLSGFFFFPQYAMTLTATSQPHSPYKFHYPFICHILEILHKLMHALHPISQPILVGVDDIWKSDQRALKCSGTGI